MARVVFMDPAYHWNSRQHGPCTVHSIGREKTIQKFLGLVPESGPLDKEALKQGLVGLKGNFAAIVEAPDFTLAVVDKIRSYPVFYVQREGEFRVSNSAQLLKEEIDLTEANELSLLEFRMAGYVTGRETFYKSLYQVQAGECLFLQGSPPHYERSRYYLFFPDKERPEKEADLIQELDETTNTIFRRLIEDANGRQVWVALSGGLDSRLVICKLKALGCENLRALSYGPPGNYEAKAAKYIAERLKVPWTFMPSTMRANNAFFRTEFRKKYWQYSNLLCTLPIMQDIQNLWDNRSSRIIPEGSYIINGNSGDFITGGHIPVPVPGANPTDKDLTQAVIRKHFSLWPRLLTPEVLARLEAKILSLLPGVEGAPLTPESFSLHYELWEWQERQCKYVVNGQRNYDYMGFAWDLPLWADEYLLFWQNVPVPLKFKQNLYRAYLKAYDFYGLFKDFPITVWRWPGAMISIIPLASLAKMLFGKKAKDSVYNLFSYWGHYRNLYAHYGFKVYLKHRKEIRSYNSLNSLQVLVEKGLSKERLLA